MTRIILAFGIALLLMPYSAHAQRVALVIGNAAYRHVPALGNPTNDAADVAVALGRLGFAVSKLDNGAYDTMRRALLEFGRRAVGAEMAVVFFAGHGIEVGGENWLIPIDAELRTDRDVESEAFGLKTVLGTIEGATKLGLVILDACRNNPFAATMQRSIRTRSVERGFARVEPQGNVLVAYAAKDGTTAADGAGRNSPFTSALLKHLETPGLEINFLFRRVRDDVLAATRRDQQPFVYGSLSQEEIFLKTGVATVPQPVQPSPAVSAPIPSVILPAAPGVDSGRKTATGRPILRFDTPTPAPSLAPQVVAPAPAGPAPQGTGNFQPAGKTATGRTKLQFVPETPPAAPPFPAARRPAR